MTSMLRTLEPEFGPTGSGVFLDHASVAPPCKAARDAVHEGVEAIARQDDGVMRSRDTMDQARAAFARLVASRADRVQCFANTSAALACVAQSIDWRRGDQVLVSNNEFVSNLLVWQQQRRHGVAVGYLRTDDEQITPDVLRAAISGRTRIVAISAVHWATGAKQDLSALAEIAHDHDALLVVDAAQSLGAAWHRPDRDGYDVLASNAYKWLLSVNGTAFADFSERALDAMPNASSGWLAVEGEPEPDDLGATEPTFQVAPGVDRLAGGAPSVLSNLAAMAAFDMFASRGLERTEREVRANADYVIEEAAARGFGAITPASHAGLIGLQVRGAERLVGRLEDAGIRLSSRGGFLRVSPHFYTRRQDIDVFLDALEQVGRG